MSDTDELLTERRGAVLVARINRPDARNALTANVMRGIGSAIVEAESDAGIHAVVVTGTGDRAFCAGMDLRAFAEGQDMSGNEDFLRLTRGEVAVPVIGAANGSAVGGGLELLLGCDLIVAAADAKFALPEVKRGLFPGGGGTFIGTRIPLSVALEMTMTGDPISAARGYEVGLVNAVVPAAEVLDTAIGYAERIAANAPLGVAACKELGRLAVTDLGAARERESHWQKVVFTSADATEGAVAFMEKRPPAWRGR
ncbi:enoyl-CoA hydratase-related protein [Aldersonia kunmingensis]|uniref:enoyl-CoA hydratase-related protein n=1 Tax=Aldersonia kunmingensis TaxID=408066 RepID=UPI00082EADDF|nr:enoyl-CoA hydratase-related protein [Aldersonia kunmingensis]